MRFMFKIFEANAFDFAYSQELHCHMVAGTIGFKTKFPSTHLNVLKNVEKNWQNAN